MHRTLCCVTAATALFFAVQGHAAQAPGRGVPLVNAGFESSEAIQGWTLHVYGARPSVAIDAAVRHEGRQSLRIRADAPSDTALGQDVDLSLLDGVPGLEIKDGTVQVGANMMTGKFDMAGYTTGFYPDPYTDQFLCSSVVANQNQGGDNNYHICDPKMDEMFKAANSSADPAVRKKAIDEIQQYQFDQAYIIPMYARANVMSYLDRFVLPPTSVIGGMMGDTFEWDVK